MKASGYKHMRQSGYVKSGDVDTRFAQTKRRSPIIAVLSSFFAILILALSLSPALGFQNNGANDKSVTYVADAAGFAFFCNDFGANMGDPTGWKVSFKDYALEGNSHRIFTAEEALGNGTRFVHYNGEGEGTDFLVADKETTPPDSSVTDKAKLESIRTVGNCTTARLLVDLSNFIINLSSGLSTISSFIVAKAFDPNLICSDTSGEQDGCFNLLKIIGGDGGSGSGIIGALTSSIYYPLLVMAVAITGLWVAYKGIVQRKLREAFFGVLWVVLSVIFGLALLLNPSLIAKAPMTVSNTVATCVIGAFNGENCFTQQSTGDGINVNDNDYRDVNICDSGVAGGSPGERMGLVTNSITCTIWKAFILNPVSEASFGTNFDSLTTTKQPLKGVLEDAGLNPVDYCINLSSTGSAEQYFGDTLQLNSSRNRVCNLMAYQMFLQVDAASTASGTTDVRTADPGQIDERWYKVIDAAAADNGMWQHWSPSSTSAMNKVALSTLTLITTALGSLILVVTAVFALVYFLSGILLMAFSPVFLLIGVHPGRGKEIMLGWLEKVVSNVLKYIASAAFLVVTIAIYSGVLSNIDNTALTLLFVIIITMALFMYRRELMELFGRVNMGGEKMSSAMSDKLRSVSSDKARRTGQFTSAVVGGSAGAMIASGKNPLDPRNFGENFKTAGFGALDAAKRDMRRGGGMASTVMQQVERSNVANRQKLRKNNASTGQEERNAQNAFNRAESDFKDKQDALIDLQQMNLSDNRELEKLEEDYGTQLEVEDFILNKMKDNAIDQHNDNIIQINNNPDLSAAERREALIDNREKYNDVLDFAELKKLNNEIRDMDIKLKVALEDGDLEAVARYDKLIADKKLEVNDVANRINPNSYGMLSEDYDEKLRLEKSMRNIGSFDDRDIDRMMELQIKQSNFEQDYDLAEREVIEATESLAQAERELVSVQAARKVYSDTIDKLAVGDTVGSKQLEDIDKRAAQAAATAADKVTKRAIVYPDDMPDLGVGSGNRSAPQQPKDISGGDKPGSGGSGDFNGSHIPDPKPTSAPGGGTENERPRQQTAPIPVRTSIPKDEGGARQDNTRSSSDTSNSQREQVSKPQPKPENSPKPEVKRTKPEAIGIPTSPTPDNNRRKEEPKQENRQQRGEKPRDNVRGAGIPRRAPKAPLNPSLNDNRQDRGQQSQDGDSNRK